MKSIVNFFKGSIIKSNKNFSIIFLLFIIIYISHQFFSYFNSRNLLEINKKISTTESQLTFFYENTIKIENLLLNYTKEVPIFKLGYISQYHPYKDDIKINILNNHKIIENLIKTKISSENMNELAEIDTIFKTIDISINKLLYDNITIAEMKEEYDSINESFFLLKTKTSKILNNFRIYRKDNIKRLENSASINLILLISLLFIIIIFLLLIFSFNRILNYKISYLKTNITNIDINNFNSIKYDYNDEINSVVKVFNNLMVNFTKTNKTLIETKNYLKNIFDSSPALLISINKNGKIRQLNKTAQFYKSFGSKNNEEHFFWEVFPFLKQFENDYNQVIFSNEEMVFKNIKYESNETKFFDITIFPLSYKNYQGAVIRAQDVTKIKSLDEQLQQAQKMETIGTLAGGLAHDFNNVLGGIKGTISLMEYSLDHDKDLDKKKLYSYFKTLQNSSDRAESMVSQLLTLSRKNNPVFNNIDLNDSLKHIQKLCNNSFDKRIEINFNIPEKPIPINADITQLEQVILNMCINAEHAMTIMREDDKKYGGLLSVSIETFYADKLFCSLNNDAQIGNYWVINIADTGVGIQQEKINKIFEPFFSTKGKGQGTGLGLSIVYNIIKDHNGFIQVYSEVGSGTKFKIYLPKLLNNQNIDFSEKQKEKLYKGEGTILVVDDEEIMRTLATKILTICGYNVLLAEDAEIAVKTFKKNIDKIDLALIDFAMPKMTGEALFEKLKEIKPNLKIVMASGFKQDKKIQSILNQGLNGFIGKPYSVFSLSKKIYDILYGANK